MISMQTSLNKWISVKLFKNVLYKGQCTLPRHLDQSTIESGRIGSVLSGMYVNKFVFTFSRTF